MALSAGQDSAGAVIVRHPELSYLFRAGRTSRRKHPRRSDRMVDTGSRAHSSDLDEDSADPDQPAKGGKPHRRGARAIMQDNPDLFADREASTGNQSYPPIRPRARPSAASRRPTRRLAVPLAGRSPISLPGRPGCGPRGSGLA